MCMRAQENGVIPAKLLEAGAIATTILDERLVFSTFDRALCHLLHHFWIAKLTVSEVVVQVHHFTL